MGCFPPLSRMFRCSLQPSSTASHISASCKGTDPLQALVSSHSSIISDRCGVISSISRVCAAPSPSWQCIYTFMLCIWTSGNDTWGWTSNADAFPLEGLEEEVQRLKKPQHHAMQTGGDCCSHQDFATSQHLFKKWKLDGKALWEVIEKVCTNKVHFL